MRGAPLHAAALLGFGMLALFVTWPLPVFLSSHLTGSPSGDTGVYVWNLWVFRHEIEQGRLPFYTSSIFSLSAAPPVGPANLSFHNYTTFANLIALPLLPRFGVVTTFNLIYLLNIVLAGYGTFLLARHLTGRAVESALAGVLFAASPVLVARGADHFSLVAAAPLPLFVLLMQRSVETGRIAFGIGAGAAVAWAVFCDAYYGVYCVMLGCLVLAARVLEVRRAATEPAPIVARATRGLDLMLLIVAAFVAALLVRGGGPVTLLGLRISTRTLYTPMLVLTILAVTRLWLTLRPRFALRWGERPARVVRALAAAAVMMLVLLAPVLYAFGDRVWSGTAQGPSTHWRSSPPGVDLLSFVLPNPNHPVWGDTMRRLTIEWSGRGDGFPEFVGSLSLVALAVIGLAWWRSGWRPPRFWIVVTVGFAWLALGPFVHVASLNTQIPTPWTFLRYLPILGLARSPTRFTVVVTLGVAILFALAIAHVLREHPQRRRSLLVAVALLLGVELLAAPRVLYSAAVPTLYSRIANDPRPDIRVLELPFGVRDGASSLGDFNARSQYHQTVHGKALVGGYLSRVSARRKKWNQRLAMLDALMTLSEGRPLSAHQERRARASADRFLARARLGYVVVDRSRASPELMTFATDVLGLTKIAEEGPRELHVPRDPRRESRLCDQPELLSSPRAR